MNDPGLRLAADDEDAIVEALETLGIDVTPSSFRKLAAREGTPSGISQSWIRDVETRNAASEGAGGEPGITALLVDAAFHLWNLWLPEVICAETLADEFDRGYEPLDTLMFGNPLSVREALERADRLIRACRPDDGGVDRDLFAEIWSHSYHDLALWLRCLPQVLAHRDMLDEAVDLCEKLSQIFDARAFLADRGLLLARAGRGEEARFQVIANVRAWPTDVTVLRKACEVLWALGDAEVALGLYDDVLELMSRRKKSTEEAAPCPSVIPI